MSRFIKSLSLFLASLPLLSSKSQAAVLPGQDEPPLDLNPVQLRPLNFDWENQFAGHRSHASHSSHASHASHYSGSGGGSYRSPTDSPSYRPASPPSSYVPPETPSPSRSQDGLRSQPSSPAGASPASPATSASNLTVSEKRMLQIIRVQLALKGLGLYAGALDGELNPGTQEAIKHFQRIKGVRESGMMTTETLNALGVMAVQ